MHVPFVDLGPAHNQLQPQLDDAIERVRKSNRFLFGGQLEAFEAEFASYIGTSHCVGVGSGTDALYLSLLAVGVTGGDEVIVPSHTFISTALAVSRTGATPVFADIDPATYTLDPASVETVIGPHTKAIVPVHLYGQCADMDSLLGLAGSAGLVVVEDACQAHGSTHRGRKAGSMGSAGCFSFYPSKNLGAWGDAGAVVTNDDAIANQVRLMRNLGSTRKYTHDVEGINSRMSEIDAAVLRVKLPALHEWNADRADTARTYREGLQVIPVDMHSPAGYGTHVFHLAVVSSDKRDVLQRHLTEDGIGTQIHYPTPIHRQKPYLNSEHRARLPVTEATAETVLSLPIYVGITEGQVSTVVGSIRRFFE